MRPGASAERMYIKMGWKFLYYRGYSLYRGVIAGRGRPLDHRIELIYHHAYYSVWPFGQCVYYVLYRPPKYCRYDTILYYTILYSRPIM